MSTEQSLLSTVDPASIDELFSRDPAKMSDADIDAIVAHSRRERSTWETKAAQAAAKKAAKESGLAQPKLTLGDLEF